MRLFKDIDQQSGILTLDPYAVYFTMELGLSPYDYFDKNELKKLKSGGNNFSEYLRMYNGGLGIYAGDLAKSASDLGIPIAFVLPYYPQGFGKQKITENGEQVWEENPLDISKHFQTIDNVVDEYFGQKHLKINGHLSWLAGENQEGPKHAIPVLLLDYSCLENPEEFVNSNKLYLGEKKNRLCQEIALGICGVKAARKIWKSVEKFQLNDSHPGLAVIELLYEELNHNHDLKESLQNVRNKVSMTTHTPITAAWDTFPFSLIEHEIGGRLHDCIYPALQACDTDRLSLGYLALWGSGYTNAVAKQNAIVAQSFREVGKLSRIRPNFKIWTDNPLSLKDHEWTIDYITNGIYHPTWVSHVNKKLFNELGNWIDNPTLLGNAPYELNDSDLWKAHLNNKQILFNYLKGETNANLDLDALTIGFARRFAPYKRAYLIFKDEERLKNIAKQWYERTKKPLQIIMAGIAFPTDKLGNELLTKIYQIGYRLNQEPFINFVFMPNYRISNARLLVSGVDVWLNTPFRPKEASGTSGMKAAINGVLNLSINDGWWIEGSTMKPDAGWTIGGRPENFVNEANWQRFEEEDSNSLYNLLNHEVIPLYYNKKDKWIAKMKDSISLGSYFNSHRSIVEYAIKSLGLQDLIREKRLEKIISL